MAQEYTITKISEDEPREWKGEHGTVYYIKVMLDGHSKPVTIGKKSKDALKVGDKVFGDIRTSDYPEDGFKAVSLMGGDNSKLEAKLDAIAGDVKLLLSFVRQLQKEQTPEKDTVIEDIGDGEIDMSQIPF